MIFVLMVRERTEAVAMRPIDADALIENHFSVDHRIALSYANMVWMRKIINDEPTLEHIPTLHSRWFRPYIKWLYPFKIKNPYCFCTNCICAVKAKKITKYCPDCGAKMDLRVSDNG